ncbi:MAG: SphA family protein [Thermodesulfobacteriota bacterium]
MCKSIVFLLMTSCLFAEMQNHYILGSNGLNSAVKPTTGFAYSNLYTRYEARQINNQRGKKVDLKGKDHLEVQYLHNIFSYFSSAKIVGASYGFQVDVPCTTMTLDTAVFNRSFDGAGKKLKLSDIYFEPIDLRWNWGQLYFFLAYGVYAPTGKFKPFSSRNTGLGDWGQMATAASTLFFDSGKTFSVSAYATYEIHSKKRGIDFTAGDNFCLEWGIGKTFDKVLTIGAVGYYERQPNRDRGRDVPQVARHARDKVLSAGPEVDLFVPQMNGTLLARYEFEFEAVSRTKGRMLTVAAVFNF